MFIKSKLNSISKKLVFSMVSVFIIIGLGIYYSVSYKLDEDLRENVLYKSRLIKNNIINSLSIRDFNMDNENLKEAIDLKEDNLKTFIGVYDNKGKLLEHKKDVIIKNSILEIIKSIEGENEVFRLDNEKNYREVVYASTYAYPINDFNLIIQYNYTEEKLRDNSIKTNILIAIFLLIIVGISTVIILIKKITKPIGDLDKQIKLYAKGKVIDRDNLYSNDEIGEMKKSFENMVCERKKLEEVRRDFFNNATHELKTPITSINSYVDVLKEYDNIDEEFKERALDRISLECLKMRDLVQNILDISRENNISFESKEEVNIKNVLEESLEELKSLIEKYNKDIELDICNIIRKINKEDLKSIFNNLILNSIKYSKENKIRIDLTCNLKVKFTITNKINKIPTDIKDRLFEPFIKYNNLGEEESITSSGLGLHLCKVLSKKNSWDLDYLIKDEEIEFTLII